MANASWCRLERADPRTLSRKARDPEARWVCGGVGVFKPRGLTDSVGCRQGAEVGA